MSAFSFPLSDEPGPISLRASSLDSNCVSDIDERTISAAGGGDGGRGGGGGEEGGGGGGGASERGLCAFSKRAKSLN